MSNGASILVIAALAASSGCTGIVEGDGAVHDGSPQQVAEGLPCDVADLLNRRCLSCHGAALPGVPTTLISAADLAAPSPSEPSITVAEMSLQRMRDGSRPMPPGAPATEAEVAVLAAWVAAGMPEGDCENPAPSPYDTPPQCSSQRTWSGGEEESPHMHPGRPCIGCHEREGEGPSFLIAGTTYPSAHEPDDCYGERGPDDAEVLITGADGRTIALTVLSSGNFFLEEGRLSLPYTAVLRASGRERAMVTPQRSGDCNACHTADGADGAPGRILLP